MHTVNILTHLVNHHQALAYGIIFLGLIFEGEITLISAGVLAHLGALNLWVTLIFVFSGGLVKTFFGYYIGIILYKKYSKNKFLAYMERKVLYFIPKFRQKPFWSIFTSKFIMGVNYLVIIFAGYKRINFKTYLKAEILSTIVWVPLLISIGLFFSYTALHITKEIGRFILIILSFTLIFLLVDKLVGFLYELFEHYEAINEEK